jgi:glutathione S-transferase
VICEYLNVFAGGHLIPATPERWTALRRQAMGDGIAAAAILSFAEQQRPQSEAGQRIIDRQRAALTAALRALDGEWPSFGAGITIGEIAVAAGLGYLSYRLPNFNWRTRHANLARWYAEFECRPSMTATAPNLACSP